MRPALVLLLLPLLACADDKDPTVCPSSPSCTTANPSTNPAETTNGSFSSSDTDPTNAANATVVTAATATNPSSDTEVEPTTNDPSASASASDPSLTSEVSLTNDPSASSPSDPSASSPSDPSASDPSSFSTSDASVGFLGDTSGGGGGDYGMCGWLADPGYYDCASNGAEPGLEGDTPIACPGGLVEGEPCNGAVDEIGCCTLEGVNFFCDTQTDPNNPVIYRIDCGA